MKTVIKKLILLATVILFPLGPLMASAPDNVEGATTVSVDEAYDLFEQDLPFVDVRKPSDFDSGRVPGAHSLDLKEAFSEATLAEVVGKDDPVVFYCNGAACERSSVACAKAVSWGYTKVYYFRDGFPGWDDAGLPIE